MLTGPAPTAGPASTSPPRGGTVFLAPPPRPGPSAPWPSPPSWARPFRAGPARFQRTPPFPSALGAPRRLPLVYLEPRVPLGVPVPEVLRFSRPVRHGARGRA